MSVTSAGILLYRWREGSLQVLLVHSGGPFWRNKDVGAWMMPKGMVEADEELSACALREFEEELGTRLSETPRHLCRIRQKGGKWVEAFALEGDLDEGRIVSNHFTLEYPPKSGTFASFPEIDAAAWFPLDEAERMILPSQLPILDALRSQMYPE